MRTKPIIVATFFAFFLQGLNYAISATADRPSGGSVYDVVIANGKIVGQARLIPVTAVGAAQLAATIGPVLAMIALQMQLSEVTGLARTNIALTSQLLRPTAL